MFNKLNISLIFFILGIILFLNGCKEDTPVLPKNEIPNAYIISVSLNGTTILPGQTKYNIPSDSVIYRIIFSSEINKKQINSQKIYMTNGVDTSFVLLNDTSKRELLIKVNKQLGFYKKYSLCLTSGENLGINLINSYTYSFITELDSTLKFPTISDDSLMTLVQKQTFKYFWDYGHPTSGLARERYGSGETVTIGGSGFGVMTIPVAIERGFITRQEGLDRMTKIVDFLKNKADKFHGAFSHWLNGTTGAVQPFSTQDNGADLVETAFMIEGLLTVQQYFSQNTTQEDTLRANIDSIWHNVEWDWFQQNGQEKLFWHWSPNYGWAINMQISGWDEALIVYVLAASSPTHSITKSVYDNGWANNGGIKNGKTFYGTTLPLGSDYGGPLFFEHYSFLGLDPNGLSDAYANYEEQTKAHAKINYGYCVANPKNNFGYSKDCWGLTASDTYNGYNASSPTNDWGTIAPTAALASFPYTPTESMQAMRFFYYILGDKIFKVYGFTDAFSLNKMWFADSFLAIDQGPIVIMMENYRTGLLWNLFMQNTDVQQGLVKLGFTSTKYNF